MQGVSFDILHSHSQEFGSSMISNTHIAIRVSVHRRLLFNNNYKGFIKEEMRVKLQQTLEKCATWLFEKVVAR